MNRMNQIIRKPLSDSELKRILGEDTRIITYPQLANYRTIEELLPKQYDFVIILLLERFHKVGTGQPFCATQTFSSIVAATDLKWIAIHHTG